MMNFEQAASKYLELRTEVDRIDREAKNKKAELNKVMADLENWFALAAEEQGLKTIPTTVGTVYWSTHNAATVAEPAVFRDYVINNSAWDLIETRASKTAVKSFIEGHGEPPPGVNFSSVRVFNLRKS
jgi:hypothetical protein